MSEETLTINTPNVTGVIITPVAGEFLKGKSILDYKIIEDKNGQKYKLLDFFMFMKDDIFPTALMLLCTGQNITKQWCYDYYKNSDRIYFLFLKKV